MSAHVVGDRVPDLEHPLRRDLPDAAQFEGKPDGVDIKRHALMVAHPDEDGRQGADQRRRAFAKDAVGVARSRLAEQARQDLADRAGVAEHECVQPVRVAGLHGPQALIADAGQMSRDPARSRPRLRRLAIGAA